MVDVQTIMVTIDLSNLPEFRLLLWTLHEIMEEMQNDPDDHYAKRLNAALERFLADDE